MESEHNRQILEMQRQHQQEKVESKSKHEVEVSRLNKVLVRAANWFPMFRLMLRMENQCHSVGFNAEQAAHLMTEKSLTYSGELYSEEYKRKIKVNDTAFIVVTDKGKLVLVVGSQHIGDWFKEQVEKANRIDARQQIKPNRGFRL